VNVDANERASATAEQNRLTIVLAYAQTAAGLHSLRVSPFLEYAARRSRVEIGRPDRDSM
jgi:hypothetical protein